MTPMLPPLLPVPKVRKRLWQIFPEGTTNRNYCTRDMAARTVFVMLYVGAVAGTDRYIRPDQITRMTDRQAAAQTDEQRLAWASKSLRKARSAVPRRWYAANTREPIRDETLREGLVRLGAVIVRPDVPTTSSVPRYALAEPFAALFDPASEGEQLAEAIDRWQEENLSAGALARVQLVRRGAVASRAGVLVTFPNGETRRLAGGPSSHIAKAVIEDFARRFLADPGVIFLSESGNRVVARDERLAVAIGLEILPDRLLPDIVLVDLGSADPLLVFVEVVATGGPMSANRREALLKLATGAGYHAQQIAFLSAYLDRSQTAFRTTISELAWGSFAWFASEPERIMQMHDGTSIRNRHLSKLM